MKKSSFATWSTSFYQSKKRFSSASLELVFELILLFVSSTFSVLIGLAKLDFSSRWIDLWREFRKSIATCLFIPFFCARLNFFARVKLFNWFKSNVSCSFCSFSLLFRATSTVLEWIVSKRRLGKSVSNIKKEGEEGSSSVFKKAFCASIVNFSASSKIMRCASWFFGEADRTSFSLRIWSIVIFSFFQILIPFLNPRVLKKPR